jgi:hypothetical protein
VAAELARDLALLFPERIFILLFEGVDGGPRLVALLPLEVDARRIVGEDSQGASNGIDAVVGMRIGDVVLEGDGEAIGCFDERRVEVAGDVLFRLTGIAGLEMSFAVLIEAALRRAHRDHVEKTVAAVDAHVIGYGAEAVRWIEVAVALGVDGATPQAFSLVRE